MGGVDTLAMRISCQTVAMHLMSPKVSCSPNMRADLLTLNFWCNQQLRTVRPTSGQEDDVRLAIATMHSVGSLGRTLNAGAWQIGHALPREGQHAWPGHASLVHTPRILNCNLQASYTRNLASVPTCCALVQAWQADE